MNQELNKYIITFGSSQLEDFDIKKLDPSGSADNIVVVIEALTENEARKIAFNFNGIGTKFCTSYPYSYMKEMKEKWGMSEYTLDDLEWARK